MKLEPLPDGHDRNWQYKPPVVVMVEDGDGGSHPEPPFTEDMSDLESLRHQAALIEHKTGIRIRVCDGASWTGKRFNHGTFSMQVGHSSLGAGSYWLAWELLNGVEIGAEEVKAVVS